MNIESWIAYSKKESETCEATEQEKTFEAIKQHQFTKQKKKAALDGAIEKELFELKELLDKGEYNESTTRLITQLIEWTSISAEEVQEIFEIIDSLDQNEKIDSYVPQDLRITKDDYQKALRDEDQRIVVLEKLDTALTHISRHIDSWSWPSLNLFSWFLAILDKNLVAIQEGHIDIKESLNWLSISQKEDANKTQSFWKKICDCIKKILK